MARDGTRVESRLFGLSVAFAEFPARSRLLVLAAMIGKGNVMQILRARDSRRAALRSWIFKLMMAGLLTIPVVGCGGGEEELERVAVEGVVTLDGQKLALGLVRFIPSTTGKKNSSPAAVAIVKEGQFQMSRSEGPVVGKHRVEIESTGHYGFEIDDEQAYAKAFQEKKGQALPPNPVPEIYNSKSTLTAEVKADGRNQFEFPLQGTAKK